MHKNTYENKEQIMEDTEILFRNDLPEAQILLYRDTNNNEFIADKDLVGCITFPIVDLINRLDSLSFSSIEDELDFVNTLKKDLFMNQFTTIENMLIECSMIKSITFDKISLIGNNCIVEAEAKDAMDNAYMIWFWLQESDRARFKFSRACTTQLPSLYIRTLYHLPDAEEQYYKNEYANTFDPISIS